MPIQTVFRVLGWAIGGVKIKNDRAAKGKKAININALRLPIFAVERSERLAI